ncbi:MAG: hypothetical protein IJ743_00165 [Bacilli bacterium]|nr:hypothetical protein [Bacilli bacterium]
MSQKIDYLCSIENKKGSFKKMNNQKKLTIGLIVALITLVTGISYAYFTATFQNLGVRETSITLAELGSLKLTASEATYTSGNQYPGDMAIQKFEVEPVTKGLGIYEIDLTGVIDESIFGNDVEIQLYKSIDNTEVTVTEGELTQDGSTFSRVDTLVTNGLTPIYTGSLKNGLNILYQEEFEVVNDNGLKIRENSESTAYPKYTFYLVYNYKNNGNQNSQMGQTFSGTISGKLIEEKEKTGLEKLQQLNPNLVVLTTTPDFSIIAPREANVDGDGKEAQISGLYAMEDDYGTSYYYRGDVNDNYVKFAGYYWRIIRINGDGTIRMIYAGDASIIDGLANKLEVLANGYDDSSTQYTQIGTSKFNESYNDNAYVGYMYGTAGSDNYNDTHANTNSSTIKTYLDTWYENNIKNTENETYIADSIFCNDRSVGSNDTITYANTNWGNSFTENDFGTNNTLYGAESRLIEEISLGEGNRATLHCPNKNDAFTVSDTMHGNGALTYPVGLLTIDEANIAGGVWGENYNYYLTTGNWYWTGSPSAFSYGYAYVLFVAGDGDLSDNRVNDTIGVRPVLNLKSDSLRLGSGVVTDPYRVS